ncbi:MAG: xanthine dehydrogenase accessory protein XdhC [Geminicoccaceae bacterium]
MMDWLTALKDHIEAGRAAALVTIADARGSAPREPGVKMLVTETESIGTVGGGNLEHEAIRIARSMLAEGHEKSILRQYALGPSLGQCCGGNTKLLFDFFSSGSSVPAWIDRLMSLSSNTAPSVLVSAVERTGFDKLVISSRPSKAGGDLDGDHLPNWDAALIDETARFFEKPNQVSAKLWRSETGELFFLEKNTESQGDILLIGAGHVGKALAKVLAPLPFHMTWADNRPEQFPEDIASTIRVRCTPHLEKAVDEAAADTIFLVMTYSHDLDYALCARVLKRGDFRYLGLIGSKTKRARFEKTMADLGIDQSLTDRVVCPIGIEGISSKQPSVIAVATAAQLLALPLRSSVHKP